VNKGLLYIFPQLSSFVRKDLSFFQKEYKVTPHLFQVKNKALLPLYLLWKIALFPIYSIGKKTVVAQFGGYHTVAPALWCKILSKKFVIVLGGYDCVSFPSIGYGAFANKWMRKAVIYSYKRADLLLPVHESLICSNYTYSSEYPDKQGIRAFIPNLKTPHQTIFNGYDTSKWPADLSKKKPRTAITIAAGIEENRRSILKGIDIVLELAKAHPDYEFIIVGGSLVNTPINVTVHPQLPQSELLKLLQQSQFYLQLSISEGFPNALCEAMLCGCIPIVSNVASMPEIIGDSGAILETKSQRDLSSILKKLELENNTVLQQKSINRITELYTETSREVQLLNAIRKLSN
jgi:glycosyltransferase involved in cell wall biosynthesis